MRRGGTYLLIGLNKSIKRMTSSVYSSRLIGAGIPPPQKKIIISFKTAAKLCALDLFFDQDSELQIYHGNFLLMHNKHRKLFVIKQPKGCKFMPKIHQNTFGGRAPPGPAAGAHKLPRPSMGLTSKGREEGEGRRPTFKGMEGRIRWAGKSLLIMRGRERAYF